MTSEEDHRSLTKMELLDVLALLARQVADRYTAPDSSEVSTHGLLCMLRRSAELELALLDAER